MAGDERITGDDGLRMTEYLLRGVNLLLAIIRVLAAVMLVGSVALNFANVVGRYFFGASIPWAEEVMLFLMVGCVFLGNGVVAWSDRQIRMDVVVSTLPALLRQALDLLSKLVFIATAVMIVVFAWPVIRDLAAFDQRSEAADFPLYIPQAMIPIGLSIMAFLVGVRILTGHRRDSSETTGH